MERAKKMAGFRKCAACYAADVAQHSHREGKGDMKGLHLTLEDV